MHPVLYSFRRCPYAMRARMALYASGRAVELREVKLSDKPQSMLACSPKGSVPVLVLPEGGVIDESWDIMLWALRRNDPGAWLGENSAYADAAIPLIRENDTTLKDLLDRYKYPERYPEHGQHYYRARAEIFIQGLENCLRATPCLLGDTLSVADAGIFPSIRQFADVDQGWFAQTPYPALRNWLKGFLDSELVCGGNEQIPALATRRHPCDHVSMNDCILAEYLHHQHRGKRNRPAIHPILCSTVNGHGQGVRQEGTQTRENVFR